MVVCKDKRVVVGIVVLGALFACLTLTGTAGAASAWWQLNTASIPTSLPPGGSGTLILTATNLGDADAAGANIPVVLRGQLPAGVKATAVTGRIGTLAGAIGLHGTVGCSVVSSSVVECTYEGALPPYEQIEADVEVQVEAGAKSGETVETAMVGGESEACEEVPFMSGKYTNSVCGTEGAGNFEKKLNGKQMVSASSGKPLRIGGGQVKFGTEDYELNAYNEDGSLDTQAGSHPFDLTTTFMLNRTGALPYQPAMPKDLDFKLPPGLIGNPTPFPQCPDVEFFRFEELHNFCPAKAAVGVALVSIFEPNFLGKVTLPEPIFNLKPATGEPARFGFSVLGGIPVILDTSIRTGGDYGVTVSVNNISQLAALYGSQVTFWGVPGDPAHDSQRGWNCIEDGFYSRQPAIGACAPLGQSTPPPLLSLPTSCGTPMQTSVAARSWVAGSNFLPDVSPSFEQTLDGCNRLPFDPSISVAPDGEQGSSPTGLTVGIHVPQDLLLNPGGLAEANVKDTTVTLPAGVALNPAAADGLMACSESQIALSEDTIASCPQASKVGTVEIKSPLLPNPLTGDAFLAEQDQNPFGSLVALYLSLQDPVSGTLVKVAGEIKPDPVTGQLVSTFKNTPQLPFEDLKLHFFGGDRAPLSTPALCGSYTTTASIAPWSGNAPAESSSTFNVTSGPNGSPCQNPLPFTPELTAGSINIQAGATSPLTMTMTRQDGQQNLKAVELHMPPGIAGVLSSVKLCGEADANAGTCGPESLIGHTIVSVGLGGDPYSVTGGRVYITGPYKGAPYGLSIVNPAKAGPYDLGQVIVRAKLAIDPTTAAITVTTDHSGPYAIPQILDGIPLQIKHVNVTIDRNAFTFNPTNCNPMKITGRLVSAEGSTSAVAVPFQVTNCRALSFEPKLTAGASGKASRSNGTSLNVKLSYPSNAFGKDANIAKVKVELPPQLPSRLTTLQQACPDTTFEANPASCPAASRVGSAVARTPILPVPLTGPAYFVSHGGAKFPELVIVLQGYGVTVYLNGETFISKAGVTSSTFRTVPDVPVGSFELHLPSGPYSALGANGDLCKVTRLVKVKRKVTVTLRGRRRTVTKTRRVSVPAPLAMPTIFVAQNGVQIKRTTAVSVSGCPKSGLLHKAGRKSARKPGK